MNKQEFLNKLSHEELLILRDIMSCDITREINKRNTKTSIEVKVGDCFVCRDDFDGIFLTKVINCNFTDVQYFNCKEINIDDNEIDMYDTYILIEDFEEHHHIDSEIFDKIATLINNRDNTVDKIREEFAKQIRELCSTLLSTQTKN